MFFSLANLLKSDGRLSILLLSTNSICLAMISNGTTVGSIHASHLWTTVAEI